MAYKGENEKRNTWYLDTRESIHMCGFKNMFAELDELEIGHVNFGDASKILI